MADPVVIIVPQQSPIAINVHSIGVMSTVVERGPPGADGGSIDAGPGFKIVGVELRYDISSLTRA